MCHIRYLFKLLHQFHLCCRHFQDEFKTVSSEIATIHITLKRTETLGCFGGKPTPNYLCQVTQTVFQFVYKLESGWRMPNFTNGLKINRPCWLRSESTADSRCCFHYPRLCLVYGLIVLSRIWCPTLSSLATPFPDGFYSDIKKNLEGNVAPTLCTDKWAPVSCQEILEMGHEFLYSPIFILLGWSLNVIYIYRSIL